MVWEGVGEERSGIGQIDGERVGLRVSESESERDVEGGRTFGGSAGLGNL